MAVIRRKPWFKIPLSLHRSRVRNQNGLMIHEQRSFQILQAQSNPSPCSRVPLRWRPEHLSAVQEIDKFIALPLPSCSVGKSASLTAGWLRCLFAVSLKCGHCWWCTSQMEVISFEVVPLEAPEQSNCINSSVWVEKLKRVHGSTALKWRKQSPQVHDCKDHGGLKRFHLLPSNKWGQSIAGYLIFCLQTLLNIRSSWNSGFLHSYGWQLLYVQEHPVWISPGDFKPLGRNCRQL